MSAVALAEALFDVRAGRIDVVDVPARRVLSVDGTGPPDGSSFQSAIATLYPVAYSVHFAVKRELRRPHHVGPLEALWWSDDPAQLDVVESVRRHGRAFTNADMNAWRWRAFIGESDDVPDDLVVRVIREVTTAKPLPAGELLRFQSFEEGLCVQTLHVGPYATEGMTLGLMFDFMTDRHLVPIGYHHEIYLSDPRQCSPARLRTILRQPVRR